MSGLPLLGLARAALGCEQPASPAELDEALARADQAMAVLDVPAFEAAAQTALDRLACLGEPLTPEQSAVVHRVVGLRAFGRREALAPAAFAAARRAAPEVPLPQGLFPADSPVSNAWSALPLDGLQLQELPAPEQGWLVLDGVVTGERAVGLPVVLQWVREDGAVGLSRYLEQDGAPGLYPVAGEPRRGVRARAPLAATTAGTGALAATLWGLSLYGHARYLDLDRPVGDDRLDGLRTRTNTLAVASAGSAALCAVSGLLLVVTW
jgi:hypothetical protein